MKIRTLLTLQYTLITALVFVALAVSINYLSERARSNTFFRDLKSEAITKAHLFLNSQIDSYTLQSIYLNNKQFIDEVEVAVYDPDFNVLYHDALQNDIITETPEMINRILEDKEINFNVDQYQGIGFVYPYDGKDYVVTAAAYDGYGYANRDALRKILLILLFSGIVLLIVIGYLLSRAALKPMRAIVREMENITASDIDKRLIVANAKDELGELSLTFNDLLERLEHSFKSQKMFVSNVSHELRTPMAALIAELDLALHKDRTPQEYQQAIRNALQDSYRMIKLIDGLLNLAKADYQPVQIKMKEVRLDELLLDAREMVLKAHSDYRVDLLFEQESDSDDVLTVIGNSYLLTTAFVNLIENNCKYSANHTSTIQISFWEDKSIVRFSDNGLGMSEIDQANLFTLFYRGENKQNASGHGIGMTVTQKIIQLHKGTIAVSSQKGHGTTFVVELKHI